LQVTQSIAAALRSALFVLCALALTAQTASPIPTPPNTTTVTLRDASGLLFVRVTLAGKPYTFLLDSASQGDFIDPSLAQELGLHPEGSVEVSGASRVTGAGIALLPAMTIGDVVFPPHRVSVFKLPEFTPEFQVVGVLGYPFFSVTELRLDPTRETMTVAPPGTMSIDGARIDADTSRHLPEIGASVQSTDTHLIVDTGNANELLIFKHFIDAHPGLISLAQSPPVLNRAIGGSVSAVSAVVGEIQLGPYHMYNRRTNVIMRTNGAFDDPGDGGNVGYGTLRNFVVTFDLADKAIYLQRALRFDDGHDRPQDRIGNGGPFIDR
jgi:hypothetical protein